MFYHAANEGLVDPASSVQIGIRTYNADSHGFSIFSTEDVVELGTDALVKEVRRASARNRLTSLSISIALIRRWRQEPERL